MFSLVLSSSAAQDGKKHVDQYTGTHKGLLIRLEGLSARSGWIGADKQRDVASDASTIQPLIHSRVACPSRPPFAYQVVIHRLRHTSIPGQDATLLHFEIVGSMTRPSRWPMIQWMGTNQMSHGRTFCECIVSLEDYLDEQKSLNTLRSF